MLLIRLHVRAGVSLQVLLLLLAVASALHAGEHDGRDRYALVLPDSTEVDAPVQTSESPFKRGRSGLRVYVYGDDGQLVSDADVQVFSLIDATVLAVPFDTLHRAYSLRVTWVKDFEYEEVDRGIAPHRYKKLRISKAGYQPQEYYLNECCDAGLGRVDIYLARPGERLYYDGCHGIPFTPHRDLAYVEFIWSDAGHRRQNQKVLKELGLQVVRNYPGVAIKETSPKQRGRRSRVGSNGVVVRKSGGGVFDAVGDTVLGALRGDTLVRTAGMVRGMSGDRVDAYDNRLVLVFGTLEDALLENDYETVTNLLWGMGASDIVVQFGDRLIAEFDAGMGEGILDIADSLRRTRLFDALQNTDVGTFSHFYQRRISRQPKPSSPGGKRTREASRSASQLRSSGTIVSGSGEVLLPVRVVGDSGEVVNNVIVSAYRHLESIPRTSLAVGYDSSRSLYLIPYKPTKMSWLVAWAPGRVRQVRPLSSSVLSEVIDGVLTLRLYSVRLEYYWLGSWKVLYESRPDWMSLRYKPGRLAAVERLVQSLDLRVVGDLELEELIRGPIVWPWGPNPFRYRENNLARLREAEILMVAKRNGELFDRYDSRELEGLRGDTNVIFAGPTSASTHVYVHMHDNDIRLRLSERMTSRDLGYLVAPYGLSLESGVTEDAKDRYRVSLPLGMGEGARELIDRLILVKGIAIPSSDNYQFESWLKGED